MKREVCKQTSLRVLIAAIATCGLGACSTSDDNLVPDQAAPVYSFAGRQTAPEPIYNRLRWVELPDPLPERTPPRQSALAIRPIMRLNVKEVPLEELATLLGNSMRYRSYCSGLIAHRQVSIDAIGDVDELAAVVSKSADVRVVVDHQAREVRVFQSEAVVPRI